MIRGFSEEFIGWQDPSKLSKPEVTAPAVQVQEEPARDSEDPEDTATADNVPEGKDSEGPENSEDSSLLKSK